MKVSAVRARMLRSRFIDENVRCSGSRVIQVFVLLTMVVWNSSASRAYASGGMCGKRITWRETSPQMAMSSIKKAIGLRVGRSSSEDDGWFKNDWK